MRIFHPLHSCYMILTYAGCLFLYTSQWHHRYARVMLNFLWWHHNLLEWRHCHVTVTFSFSICEELIVQKSSPIHHSDITVLLLWYHCFITVTSLLRGQITGPAYVNMRKIDTRVVSRTLIDVCWQTINCGTHFAYCNNLMWYQVDIHLKYIVLPTKLIHLAMELIFICVVPNWHTLEIS